MYEFFVLQAAVTWLLVKEACKSRKGRDFEDAF